MLMGRDENKCGVGLPPGKGVDVASRRSRRRRVAVGLAAWVCFAAMLWASDATRLLGQSSSPTKTCLRNFMKHPHDDPGTAEMAQRSTDIAHKLTGGIQGDFKTKPRKRCVAAEVPKKLHYVWFGNTLPDTYIRNIELASRLNPQWQVVLWIEHNEGVRERFAASAAVSVRNLTEEIKGFRNGDILLKESNLAAKADYARLEVVFLEGGMYQDTDSIALRPFDEFGSLFRWPFVTYVPDGYSNLSNGVFAFEKGSAFLDFALDLAREQCIEKHTCGVLSGAGPGFLTGAFQMYDDASDEITMIHQNYLVARTADSITHHTMDATWLTGKLPS